MLLSRHPNHAVYRGYGARGWGIRMKKVGNQVKSMPPLRNVQNPKPYLMEYRKPPLPRIFRTRRWMHLEHAAVLARRSDCWPPPAPQLPPRSVAMRRASRRGRGYRCRRGRSSGCARRRRAMGAVEKPLDGAACRPTQHATPARGISSAPCSYTAPPASLGLASRAQACACASASAAGSELQLPVPIRHQLWSRF